MKAFVTGSTGFLGSSLVQQLLAEEHEVVALARSVEKAARFLDKDRVEIVAGDMLDIPAFTPHLAGCEVLFHTAAYFKEYTGIDEQAEQLLQRINVDGTIALFNAAKAQGIKNIIYVSSSGVINRASNGQSANESSGYNISSTNRYFQSKIRAEEAVKQWLEQNPDMRVVMILPVGILGPGDNGPTGMGRMIVDTLRGDLPAVPSGAMTVVDVRDVAKAMLKAVTKGERGERFIIASQFQTIPNIVNLVAKAGSVKAPSFTLPYPMAWAFGAFSEILAKVTGQPPLATRILIQTLNEGTNLSSAKAQDELGMRFRPIEETIKDTVTWFREFGYV